MVHPSGQHEPEGDDQGRNHGHRQRRATVREQRDGTPEERHREQRAEDGRDGQRREIDRRRAA